MSCFDVVVVGGGPMGLAAAYECAVKLGKRVLVLEQLEEFANAYGSSPGYSRQFRISYSEENLSELAIETSPMWNTLMEEMKNPNLLQRTGCLWFGDPIVENSEGNIDEAADNLRNLGQKEPEDFEVLEGKDEILNDERFSFVSKAVEEIEGTPKALFTKDGGTVNVPDLVKCYIDALEESGKATLVKKALVTKIDYSKETIDVVALVDGKSQSYRGKKVIMTPGTYVNDVLATLVPNFPKRINLAIYLWSSTYFKTFQEPCCDVPRNPSQWPIWYFFGKPKLNADDDNHEDHVLDHNAYYGFPSEPQRPNYLRVAPAFTSREEFDFQDYPPAPAKEKRPVDEDAMKFTSDFVNQYMPDLSPDLIDSEETTCVAGFAEFLNSSDKEDNSAGFVLDFVVQKRIVLFTGGWGMKYVPMIGKILTDLVICGHTEYQKLIEPMNINRGILKPVETSRGKREEKRVKLSAAI